MSAYYNDIEPFVCDWLRELMRDGLIAEGDIDSRSITDIEPDDLLGYTRCHFFAGIGGWDLALQWAGWPEDRPVWTGSCPCQPFSTAGKQKGTDDERHLWPAFHRLIAECKPPTVFGEQVASKAGRAWLSGVFADLEDLGYRRAGADLCAAGVGAPHIRQRLWWVADAISKRDGRRCGEGVRTTGTAEAEAWEQQRSGDDDCTCSCNGTGLGNRQCSGLERHAGNGDDEHEPGRVGPDQARSVAPAGWDDCGLVRCVEPDREVYRRAPLEPSIFPLAYGVSNRVGILRGAGNAIVSQVAAELVTAYMGVA